MRSTSHLECGCESFHQQLQHYMHILPIWENTILREVCRDKRNNIWLRRKSYRSKCKRDVPVGKPSPEPLSPLSWNSISTEEKQPCPQSQKQCSTHPTDVCWTNEGIKEKFCTVQNSGLLCRFLSTRLFQSSSEYQDFWFFFFLSILFLNSFFDQWTIDCSQGSKEVLATGSSWYLYTISFHEITGHS